MSAANLLWLLRIAAPCARSESLPTRALRFEPLEQRTLLSVLFEEGFETDTSSTAETLATYTDFLFTASGRDRVVVDGGVLQLPVQADPAQDFLIDPGFLGDLTIQVDVGKTPGGGEFGVGLRIGENRLMFFPGFAGNVLLPPGSFRVEGPGGFANQDMGFVPAVGVLHHLEVTVTPATGAFQIELTDGDDPMNVYAASFTNTGYVAGDPLGLITNGGLVGTRLGQFDNLTVLDGSASVIFQETFDTDTTSTAETLATYSDFSFTPSGIDLVTVDGAVLQLPVQADAAQDFFLDAMFPADFRIEVDLGKTPGGGDSHVGLRIGDNRLVFHPGFAGNFDFPPGSFRVQGPGGFGNHDMGFVPAADTLHHLEVIVTADTGHFQIELTDGDDPSNVYTATFTNPGYTPGDPIALVTGGALGGVGMFDNLKISSVEPSLPAVFRDGIWFLRGSATSGMADAAFAYGIPGDVPVMGDWDGDGVKTVGVFRDGTWFLRNSNTTGMGEIAFSYGLPGDLPVVGDWNGDGIDTPGVVRDNIWFLRNSNTTGMGELVFTYGANTDTPIVGDWDGDGVDTPGVVQDDLWFLRNSNTTGMGDIAFDFGTDGRPVVGDWDGDGVDTPGVVRKGVWQVVRSGGNEAATDVVLADLAFSYGVTDDLTLVWGAPSGEGI